MDARTSARLHYEEEADLRPDALSDVLGSVRLSGTLFCRASLTAPWGVHTTGLDGGLFHAVLRGRAVCVLDDGRARADLGSGDVVFLPHGAAHRMLDDDRSEAVPIRGRVTPDADTGVGWLRLGGGGAGTELLCGRFDFERAAAFAPHPLLGSLPPLIHLRARDEHLAGWLPATAQLLAHELLRRAPGSPAVIARLCEVLVVQGVRATIEADAEGEGWLPALKDRHIAAALDTLHASPARAWSGEELARVAGMSRSAFFARFKERVGDSPQSYLLRWRMHLAARAFASDPASAVGDVAERVGYQSEASFAKAFKRTLGVTPADYRRNGHRWSSGGPTADRVAVRAPRQ